MAEGYCPLATRPAFESGTCILGNRNRAPNCGRCPSNGEARKRQSVLRCSSGSFGIHGGNRQLAQRFVRLLFLRQRLIEKFDRILVTQLISPGFQGAIARNLVMLDRLSRCQKSRVECRSISVLVHDFLAFVEDALDGIALLAARRLAEKLKDLFEAFDLPFGFVVMLLKSVP